MKILKNKESDVLDGKYIQSRRESWTKFYKIFDIRDCKDTPHYIGFCSCNTNVSDGCSRGEKKYIVLLDPSKNEYIYCYYHEWEIKDQE